MKLYTWPDCTQCEAVKGYIKEHNIQWVETIYIDMDTREWRDLQREHGILWVPVLEVNWERFMRDDIFIKLK